MSRFQVIVGNIGTVLDTDNHPDALRTFHDYVDLSKRDALRERPGRAAGEAVTLMVDGEPDDNFDYHPPELDTE